MAALALTACPPANAKPCATDDECGADQRCRRGACGPICLDDTECGDAQVCRAGVCKPRPECARDTDCASGFVCKEDRCQCTQDASCAANQLCTNGTCTSRKRCTADADCIGTGGRCEVTQGLCLPVCLMPADCAPQLDPRVAFAIYTCVQGTCTRRCTTDAVCGGQGLVCKNGLCATADCATAADCPHGQYCTSATFGRCLAYQTCALTSECPANHECKRFTATECPPGFDCAQKICRELPRCLSDQDCVSGIPGTPQSEQNGFCDEGHCQPTTRCLATAGCPTGRECVGQVCVPAICRGHPACGAGRACIDGACVSEPAAGELNLLRLSPTRAILEVGDTLQLHLIGFKLDGTSFPLTQGTYAVVDEGGAPSAAATVTPAGLVTAVSPGRVVIRASVTGSVLPPVESTLALYPRVTSGRRVLVVDAATKTPQANVKVWGCEVSACTTPTEIVTGADGAALFPSLGAGPATFTAVSPDVRGDGLPRLERASVLATSATDVYLPLRDNPARAQAGFNAGLSFSDVSTVGGYWAGYVAASAGDVPSLTVGELLGDNFFVELPGLGQAIPVPASVVLYTSPGFGIPQEVKERSLGIAQAGTRFTVAFAGRANVDQVLTLRSTDFLGYLGAFDYALDTGLTTATRPLVPDTTDINGNRQCSNPQRCPQGTEDVPDYAAFPRLAFKPARQQQRRTEVVLPRLPGTLDTVLVCPVEVDLEAGLLPVGFASATAGAPAADGTRAVDPVVVRSGAPYNGVEVATPGIWALAGSAQGSATSGRLTRGALLPTKVLVTPFLPVPANSSFAPATRTFNPGQPAWASVYSTGGELARVSVTGTQQRHTLYFSVQSSQTAVQVPPTPAGPGTDPTGQTGTRLEVVAVDLASGTDADELYSLRGPNLTSWAAFLDGYSRVDR